MGLLSPWFLAGAAAVALPLYLHLLRRHKADPHRFSSLMFFEQRKRSPIKHRRLRYLALLSLRIGLLLLIALAFANPFLRRPAFGAGGDKLLLLVIDNSFSMRAGSRLADAQRQALWVLASRPAAQRAQVMTLGAHLQALTQPTEDAGTLRAAVASVQAGDSRSNLAELAHALRSVRESANSPIELHFFSDMQKSAMPTDFAEMVLPAGVTLVPHVAAAETAPNWAVESVDAPGEVWGSKKAAVRAVIAGFHTPAATREASLVINGKTAATRSVQVPAGGRTIVEFPPVDVPYGFSRCEVKIDGADSLAADDVSRFAIRRADPAPVLFVYEPGDARSAFYFRTALASSAEGAFSLDTVPADQSSSAKLSEYAFVVLSDVLSMPKALDDALLAYVHNGGGVMVAAGTASARGAVVPVFGSRVAASHDYARDGERFLTLGDADSASPSISKADRWSGVKFYFAVQVEAGNARVLARLSDQTPLLLEKQMGAGRVLLLASGLDNLTNDFPVHPAFVPFVEQTALYLSGTELGSGMRTVDAVLQLRSAVQKASSVEVIDPDGRRPLSLQDAASAISVPLTRTGFYEVRQANGRERVVGVNADRRESDLEVMPDEVLSLWKANGGSQTEGATAAGQPQEELKPRSFWWDVMIVALIAALVESVVASGFLGKLQRVIHGQS